MGADDLVECCYYDVLGVEVGDGGRGEDTRGEKRRGLEKRRGWTRTRDKLDRANASSY